jgi:cellulose synthase/poly-beta-1,6-N-acetylglucosamine synthase-like glycosyltransferase
MLDNDVELPEDPSFLNRVEAELARREVVEFPKEAIGRTPIARMMSMEFLSFAMISWTMASLAGRSPSMNGAAFAVDALTFRMLGGFRPVVNEDMDFAARAFQLGARFGFPRSLKVRNEVPEDLSRWVVQRKRWALNNVLWVRENLPIIVAHFFRTPALFLSTVLLFLPFLSYLAVYFLARDTVLAQALPLVFTVTQHFHVLSGFFLVPAHLGLIMAEGWVPTLAGVLVALLTFSRSRAFSGFALTRLISSSIISCTRRCGLSRTRLCSSSSSPVCPSSSIGRCNARGEVAVAVLGVDSAPFIA